MIVDINKIRKDKDFKECITLIKECSDLFLCSIELRDEDKLLKNMSYLWFLFTTCFDLAEDVFNINLEDVIKKAKEI